MTKSVKIVIASITSPVDVSTPETLIDLGFTLDQIKEADEAMITAWEDGLLFKVDGSNPAISDAHIIPEGTNFIITGRTSLLKVKFLSANNAQATTATITLYKN